MTDLYKVLVSEDLFLELGGDRVAWGDPDPDGFYTPEVLIDDSRLAERLHFAAHPSHPLKGCPMPALIAKMVERFRAAP